MQCRLVQANEWGGARVGHTHCLPVSQTASQSLGGCAGILHQPPAGREGQVRGPVISG